MFENETQRVLYGYSESVKLLKKLQTLMAPYEYGQKLRDVVFYNCLPRVYSLSSLEYDAHYALSNIVKRYNLHRVPESMKHLYSNDEVTVKEHAKALNKITPEVFYYNAFYTGVYNTFCGYNKNNICRQSFNNNTYEDKRAYESGMYLILDCVNLLDNPEPLTYEQRQAINKALKENNTFIFKGCKVTLYNNGRLVVKFSNSELFKRFKNKADEAIKLITKELKKEA